MKKSKARMQTAFVIFVIILVFILVNYRIHVNRTDRFNEIERYATAASSDDSVNINMHLRGQETDSWVKNDCIDEVGSLLYGTIYEATINNTSEITVGNWQLKIDISEDCYLNNAWCGTVEVHQFVDGKETSQTLDLRQCEPSSITLNYYVYGADIMIPLSKGDYIIYKPSEADKETPIVSTEYVEGRVNTGIIFYTYDDSNPIGDYTLIYHYSKSYEESIEATIFKIAIECWVISFIAFIVICIIINRSNQKAEQDRYIINEIMNAFSSFVDTKDSYTAGHSERVAYYSGKLAEAIGLPFEEGQKVFYQAMMHDIGKCYLSDDLIHKEWDSLSPEEQEAIMAHTIKGGELLKKIPSISDLSDGALYHHERYDGTGFPEGLKGEDIPLSARIIAVVDYYDNQKTGRHYRSKISKEEIVSEIRSAEGTRFDPAIAETFIQVLDQNQFPEL